MRNYSYLPLEKALENATRQQLQIRDALKQYGETGFNDLHIKVISLMGRNIFNKELRNLINQKLVFKTDSGKYQLTKPVRLEQSKHPFMKTIEDGKIVDSEIKYFDLDEIPTDIREGLTNVPICDRVGWESLKNSPSKK